MKRRKDAGWRIAFAGIAAGFLLGAWLGYRLLPGIASADISRVSENQKAEYVAMVAQGYVANGDLAQAQARLAALALPDADQAVGDLAAQRLADGASPAELSALAQLTAALGIVAPDLAVYLPTATPTPAPSPTPIPPTPTPEPPSATPTFEPTPAGPPVAIANDDINVRSGPGTDFDIVGGMFAGDRAAIISRNAAGDWLLLQFEQGTGWVRSDFVTTEGDVSTVVVAQDVPNEPTASAPTPTPLPTQPKATPLPLSPTNTPVPAGNEFRVVSKRLWAPQENGGWFDGPSLHCGEKRQLRAIILDAAGNRLNGVTVLGVYSGDEEVSGSKGPGIAEWVLGDGDGLRIVRDADGRTVTSDQAEGMVTDPARISDTDMIAAGFCADATSCNALRQTNACHGHYSWDVTFQRAY